MGVDSKMKMIKTQLRACFLPVQVLSGNKFVEINTISNFKLLKVVIIECFCRSDILIPGAFIKNNSISVLKV